MPSMRFTDLGAMMRYTILNCRCHGRIRSQTRRISDVPGHGRQKFIATPGRQLMIARDERRLIARCLPRSAYQT